MTIRERILAAIIFAWFASSASAQERAVEHREHREISRSNEPTDHVPPDPPTHLMEEMSYQDMVEQMQMDDTAPVGRVLFNQLEWRNVDRGDALAWDAHAFYGGDLHKVALKADGERLRGSTTNASLEILWDRIYARWWRFQMGARQDLGAGPSRTWAAIGIEGLAPYWFNVEASLYIGDAGRTAARFTVDYDLRITQQLILQPEVEVNVYGKSDSEREIGSGLSDLDAGLRLRYEISRELAPYVGVTWEKRFGGTADYSREHGEPTSEVQWTVGVRVWF